MRLTKISESGEWVTVKEASELTGLSPQRIREMIKARQLVARYDYFRLMVLKS